MYTKLPALLAEVCAVRVLPVNWPEFKFSSTLTHSLSRYDLNETGLRTTSASKGDDDECYFWLIRRWLQLQFDFSSTPFDCRSTLNQSRSCNHQLTDAEEFNDRLTGQWLFRDDPSTTRGGERHLFTSSTRSVVMLLFNPTFSTNASRR